MLARDFSCNIHSQAFILIKGENRYGWSRRSTNISTTTTTDHQHFPATLKEKAKIFYQTEKSRVDFVTLPFVMIHFSTCNFFLLITIFIIEISLKLHLHTKYGWNNPNSHRFGLKSQKLNFFGISSSSKIHPTHKHSNTCHGLNFHRKLIF